MALLCYDKKVSLALESSSQKGGSVDQEDRACISESSWEDFWVTFHGAWRIHYRHGILSGGAVERGATFP